MDIHFALLFSMRIFRECSFILRRAINLVCHYYAISQKLPFSECHSLDELIKAKSAKPDPFPFENDQMENAYHIAEKCLNGELESMEKLKDEFSKLPDVDDFIKTETINFNYNEGINKG